MGLFDKIFGNKSEKQTEPDWDKFESLQIIDKQPFAFAYTNFKVWGKGKIVSQGNTSGDVQAIVINDGSASKQFKVLISDDSLYKEILPEIYYDEFITSNDRLQLITIPENSKTANTAISLFKMTLGATRLSKEFSNREPYCCNLFLLDGVISKITFSFSNPDKLIELENIPDETENLYNELHKTSKKLLFEVNTNIKLKIEQRFNTVVNEFGSIHCSESKFKDFISPQYIGKFMWCNYFVIPVDYEDEIILP